MTNDASRHSLGRMLVERGVITEEQAGESGAAAGGGETRIRSSNWKPLGTLLVEKGFISDVQLKQALSLQEEEGGFLGEILVDQGWLTAADLVLALAAQLGLDFDVKRAVESRDGTVILPSDRPAAHFEVLEDVGGEVELLETAETFMEATDFVFDEVLWQREPGSLQIVRVDAGRREIVWSFRPGEAAGHAKEDMLSVFGYSVGQWQDMHARQDKGGGEGPQVAALG